MRAALHRVLPPHRRHHPHQPQLRRRVDHPHSQIVRLQSRAWLQLPRRARRTAGARASHRERQPCHLYRRWAARPHLSHQDGPHQAGANDRRAHRRLSPGTRARLGHALLGPLSGAQALYAHCGQLGAVDTRARRSCRRPVRAQTRRIERGHRTGAKEGARLFQEGQGMIGLPEENEAAAGLRVADFDFDLPDELISQQPAAERGLSRMLMMDRANGALRDGSFAELASLLEPGDLLVLNDSRVIPARLYGRRTLLRDHEKPTGRIEVLLTEPAGEDLWRALVRPGRKVAIGERLVFPEPSGKVELEAEVLERGEFGDRLLRFEPVDDFFAVLERIGHMPLPPYIRRNDEDADRERYQTVFSVQPGSVAAPTAGLHFTSQMLDALTAKGVEVARITLHVGLGTFASLRVEKLDEVHLHRERYTLSPEAADAVTR